MHPVHVNLEPPLYLHKRNWTGCLPTMAGLDPNLWLAHAAEGT